MKQKFGFPKGFFWGSATASYQVEGGIENNDWAFEARTGKTPPNGVATDHYHRYEEDFDIVQSLSHNAHRFSIEWARIEPKPGVFNEDAIEHYRKVLESLRRRNITPFVTLWHFTLPLWLYKEGGFEHPDSPYFFARYSEYVVKKLGHLATYWITINEPTVYLGKGYVSRRWPPFKRNFWLYFWVRRRLILSHRLAYKRMKEAYPDIQIGIASNNMNIKSNLNPINKVIAIFFDRFWNHTFLNAISRYQDFIGLNYYLHKKFGERDETYEKSDIGWNIYPQGIYHVLMGLKKYKKMVYI
ncbi:family 1 glycosylhydrolase, partial [Candidatus Parcubacteria bacterium]|nr:family 1 glycosylhydrolase [Candidatus Parcubacteria bacterium]